MNNAIIIPARYNSTRFPGKPLIDIGGRSLIRRVWDKCVLVLPSDKILVATDDDRIIEHCKKQDMKVVKTGQCATGTDRVYEAIKGLGLDTIVNVQGDEPLIEPDDINKILIKHNTYNDVHCGMCQIDHEDDFRSPSVPKVVTDLNNTLIYMSRAPIPSNKEHKFIKAYKQVCIYAFSESQLEKFATTPRTPLEQIEDIEILRFLEMGYNVNMVEVSKSSIAVDNPEDIPRVLKQINNTP